MSSSREDSTQGSHLKCRNDCRRRFPCLHQSFGLEDTNNIPLGQISQRCNSKNKGNTCYIIGMCENSSIGSIQRYISRKLYRRCCTNQVKWMNRDPGGYIPSRSYNTPTISTHKWYLKLFTVSGNLPGVRHLNRRVEVEDVARILLSL